MEDFLYGERKPIVIIGSSLSGAFEDRKLFEKPYFNLYLPFTGAFTGLELIKRSGRTPETLFIEINHMDRGIDSQSIDKLFQFPMHGLKAYLPFLRSKNKTLNNLTDRLIKPSDKKSNEIRPPEKLYNELLKTAGKDWNYTIDSLHLFREFSSAAKIIRTLSDQGCKVILFEMPIDPSLRDLPRAIIQREFFRQLAKDEAYLYIDNDPGVRYNTGDGVHLLSKDALLYSEYLISKLYSGVNFKP